MNIAEQEKANIQELEGIVFDIQHFSLHDGPGIRTIVFLKGCPLSCAWCSNPESQKNEPELIYSLEKCLESYECIEVCPVDAIQVAEKGVRIERKICIGCDACSQICPGQALHLSGASMSTSQVLENVMRDKEFYDTSGGGMTLSGGEPLTQPDFSLALLRGAHEMGLNTAVETTGFAEVSIMERVLKETDLILYDIKHIDPIMHLEGTGEGNTLILDNAKRAANLGVEMIFRVPVIPNYNDQIETIQAIARLGVELGLKELHLLPYHTFGRSKYERLDRKYLLPDIPSSTTEQMEVLKLAAKATGIEVHVSGQIAQ
jgi:pyruvate formate lyase activating enzyme